MSLSDRLEHTVTVARQTAGSGITKSFQNVATGVKTLIQPLDPDATDNIASGFGIEFKAFFLLSADIREGDRLTDQDGAVYGVRGVRQRNYGPDALQHLEALLSKDRATL